MSSDIESAGNGPWLQNEPTRTFSWASLNVKVYDKKNRTNKAILSDSQGCVKAGGHMRFSYILTVVLLSLSSWVHVQISCNYYYCYASDLPTTNNRVLYAIQILTPSIR